METIQKRIHKKDRKAIQKTVSFDKCSLFRDGGGLIKKSLLLNKIAYKKKDFYEITCTVY